MSVVIYNYLIIVVRKGGILSCRTTYRGKCGLLLLLDMVMGMLCFFFCSTQKSLAHGPAEQYL